MEYKVIDGADLYDLIIDYTKDDPFEELEKLEEEIKYFGDLVPNSLKAKFTFFIAIDKDKIVGVLKLKTGGQKSYEYDLADWISFVSVNKNYQNKGISRELISRAFKYLKDNKFEKIVVSGYTEDGYNYTRPIFHKEGEKNGIEVIDHDKIEFF